MKETNLYYCGEMFTADEDGSGISIQMAMSVQEGGNPSHSANKNNNTDEHISVAVA
jgi:hypothetical protein